MEEVKKDLLGKAMLLQEVEGILYNSIDLYDVDVIYSADVLQEEVLAYPLEDCTDMYVYIVIEFIHKNVGQPWLSMVVVKDLYMM